MTVIKFLKKLTRKVLPDEYVIYENPDQTQIGVTTFNSYLSSPKVHQFDTDG